MTDGNCREFDVFLFLEHSVYVINAFVVVWLYL